MVTANLSARPVEPSSWRARALSLAAICVVAAPAFALIAQSPAEAANRLPTPTNVVISDVTAHTASLNVGGAAVKNYQVRLNGGYWVSFAPASATVKIQLAYLSPNTLYSVTVQESVGSRYSASSAPVTFRSAPAPVVVAPTNLRATAVSRTAIALAWDASPTPGVSYEIALNGQITDSTNLTSGVIDFIFSYPNEYPAPILVGQPNRVSVRAITNAFGDTSPWIEISVRVP